VPQGQADVALFYYAGHGYRVNNTNYLVPPSTDVGGEEEVDDECFRATRISNVLNAAGSTANIVILDACRDNPFRSWDRSEKVGLLGMQPARGMLIAFSTSPVAKTKNALNGSNNSPYTAALIKHLKTPNIHIADVFSNVRSDLDDLTDGKQVPSETTQLVGKLYLNGKSSPIDRDKDGVPDAYDKCSDTYGTDYGCPKGNGVVPPKSNNTPNNMVFVKGNGK
jgi:uncharacterized caspase-like protein